MIAGGDRMRPAGDSKTSAAGESLMAPPPDELRVPLHPEPAGATCVLVEIVRQIEVDGDDFADTEVAIEKAGVGPNVGIGR